MGDDYPDYGYEDQPSYDDYSMDYSMFGGIDCEDGFLIPLWPGTDQLTISDRVLRGLLYFIIIVFLCIGIAVFSDSLCKSLEMMLGQRKKVKVLDETKGETQVVEIRVSHVNVIFLTLLAIAMSFPHICLGIVQTFGRGFQAGDIAPSAVLGTASFTTTIVVGLCISVVPRREIRKVKSLKLYITALSISLLAYLWPYLTLGAISYGTMESWESIVTLLFIPVFIIITYLVDRSVMGHKIMKITALGDSAVHYRTPEFEASWRGISLQMKSIRGQNPGITDEELVKKAIMLEVYQETKSQDLTEIPLKDVEEADTQDIEGMDTIFTKVSKARDSPIKQQCTQSGELAFVLSILMIIILTTILGDLTSHLGCFIGLKNFTSGFLLLGVGLSIHRIFLLKKTCLENKSADACLYLILASNTLSLLFTLGLPWIMSAIYWEASGQGFYVNPGSLGFANGRVFGLILTVNIILLGRRLCCGGAELGGNLICKVVTTCFFVFFWLEIVVNVGLENYAIISPGF